MTFVPSIVRLSLIATVLFSTAFHWDCAAQDRDTVFRSANASFEKGEYEQASLKYRTLVENGLSSPDLFYNLGTSLYREGKPGEALLWLRRAQLLDENLPEARQNTEFLRNRIGFLEFADNGMERFLRSLSSGVFLWGATLLFWGGLLSFGLGFSLPRFRDNRTFWIALGIAFLMLSLVAHRLGQFRDSRIAPENFGTVIQSETVARTAPTPGSSSVIELPPGSEVRILQKSGPWSYVDIPGNLRGWVRTESVEANWPLPTLSKP